MDADLRDGKGCKARLRLRLVSCSPIPMRNVPAIDYSEAKKIVDLIVDKAARLQNPLSLP
jgi:hypothetical protein